MNKQPDYKERGYLKNAFHIFHLKDALPNDVPFHYHEFLKIFILLHGNVSYIVEGNEYELRPHDIVLINAGELHRPVVHDAKGYERIIIYLSPAFFNSYPKTGLGGCFQKNADAPSHVIRYSKKQAYFSDAGLADAADFPCDNPYTKQLLQQCKILEFLIILNDWLVSQKEQYVAPITRNENVLKILHYINGHLTQNLSVEQIAAAVHLNRSYLMHKFKEETGYTIKEFITEKRLLLARNYIKKEIPLTEACYLSGFSNYSSFYRAYTGKYGCSPKQQKNIFSASETKLNE